MNNKNKRISLRNDFLKNFNENDYYSCSENMEAILKLYNQDEKNDMEYYTDLYNSAYIQQAIGKYSLAITYYKKLLKCIEQKEYDINNSEELKKLKFLISVENGIGICYTKSTIKQSFSLGCFERALALCKKYFDNNIEDVINIYHNIGCAYFDLEKYENAIYYFLEELSKRKSKDIHFVDNLNFLGYSYEKMGKYEESISYLKKALDILTGLVGMNSEEYMANVNYLSGIYFKNKDYDFCITNYKKSANIIEQRLGSNHPYLAECFSKISDAYFMKGSLNDAMKLQLKSASIIKESVGEKHIFYASSLKKLADICYASNEFEKSLKYYEMEQDIKKDVIGIYNEDYVNCLLNLINLYIKLGEKEKEQEVTETLVKMVDFDLNRNSYIKALLIMVKIYIENDDKQNPSNEVSTKIYGIYEYYKNVSDKSFDEMLKLAQEIDEDILSKDKIFEENLENLEDLEDYEDDEDDIFDGLINLFDKLKSDIDSAIKKENNDTQYNENINDDIQDKNINQNMNENFSQDDDKQDENFI